MKIGAKTATGGAGAIAMALALIVPWEGLSLQAYPDVVGVWTACYGETRGVRPGQTYTRAQCETMLSARVKEFDAEIRKCLPSVLPDGVRGAFISAAYNIGSAAFCGSSMSRRALAGDLRGACDALLLWNKAGKPLRVVRGLTNRREAERKVCLEALI